MRRKKQPDSTMIPEKYILHAIQSGKQVDNPLKACYGWVHNDPPKEVYDIIRQTSLHHLIELKNIHVDRNFITAIVERWRPETHTFHFPYGECTVTLEDVSVLFGLPINGRPVTNHIPNNPGQAMTMCKHLLGRALIQSSLKKNNIHIDWLKEHFGSNLRFDKHTRNVDRSIVIQWHARGYILLLLALVLFPDKNGDTMHIKWLAMIDDLEQLHTYSWGSACLAFLYRALCRATREECKQIDGALMLLQVWAWYRLPFIAPVPRNRVLFPLAIRWLGALLAGIPNTRVHYRKSLVMMGPDDFVWLPYRTYGIDAIIPDDIKEFISLGRAIVPLICFEAVEWHAPDRVTRQFGLVQNIPVDPKSLGDSHNKDLRKNPTGGNWMIEHDTWIRVWENRYQNIIQGQNLESYTPSVEYWEWYRANSLSMIVSPEPLRNDPRHLSLPIHRATVIACPRSRPHAPQPSNYNWPTWGEDQTYNTLAAPSFTGNTSQFNPRWTPTSTSSQQSQGFFDPPFQNLPMNLQPRQSVDIASMPSYGRSDSFYSSAEMIRGPSYDGQLSLPGITMNSLA